MDKGCHVWLSHYTPLSQSGVGVNNGSALWHHGVHCCPMLWYPSYILNNKITHLDATSMHVCVHDFPRWSHAQKVNKNMKISEQCRIAASKGNQVPGKIKRNITCREKGLIVHVYKAIVRPRLEYCMYRHESISQGRHMLEKIQRRATKLIPGLKDLRYED